MTPAQYAKQWRTDRALGRRYRARKAGYAPPLAWDDNTIDDPAAHPHGARPTAPGIDLDEFARLVRWGEPPEFAARRCGVRLDSVQANARRYGRTDIADLIRQAEGRAA